MRIVPVAFVPLCFDADRLWPLTVGLGGLGTVLALPFQFVAAFELEIPRGWLTLQQLEDCFNPKFR